MNLKHYFSYYKLGFDNYCLMTIVKLFIKMFYTKCVTISYNIKIFIFITCLLFNKNDKKLCLTCFIGFYSQPYIYGITPY